jgi:hypothetical protein
MPTPSRPVHRLHDPTDDLDRIIGGVRITPADGA